MPLSRAAPAKWHRASLAAPGTREQICAAQSGAQVGAITSAINVSRLVAATHHLHARLAIAFRLTILLRYPARIRSSTTSEFHVSESSTTLIAVAMGAFVHTHFARNQGKQGESPDENRYQSRIPVSSPSQKFVHNGSKK
jgi:hypothetical protein